MSGAHWPRYPPCALGSCQEHDARCCALGHKFYWPELLGKPYVPKTIEKDNPEVTVVILGPGRVGPTDFCCNRVFVFVDDKGIVTNRPMIG